MPLIPDHEIRSMVRDKIIGITPYDEIRLNPASYDLTLSSMVRVPIPGVEALTMLRVPEGHTEPVSMRNNGSYVLEPGDFILGSTNEVVKLPDDLVARVEGKSSIGRVGLAVHITAGFIDPGFEGDITLEIANLSPWSIMIISGQPIAQIAFETLTSPAERPYSQVGHYMHQRGPCESRFRIEQPWIARDA